eukprot:GEMP01026766.1.p1 GENE.GEMP01026766.1~~GEMP01026766.1.p1  ORF type:complete len:456 (+),score=43.74 GEMP01026766.1:137-1504(+)
MVLVWIVRLANSSDHVYNLEYTTGFLTEWNAPKVDGSSPPYVVMPRFASDNIRDFAIPHNGSISIWCANDESNKIEIFIGPRPGQIENEDWLQYRTPDGKPVAMREWRYVGETQMFGGCHLELQLKFNGPLSAGIKHAISWSLCSVNEPDDVLLNVYDLAPQISSFNGFFANQAYTLFGFFHAGIEIYGEEWSFYRTPGPECGICRSRKPKMHSVHVFRQTVNLGKTRLSKQGVRDVLTTKLRRDWRGDSYDLLAKNCISFCDAFAVELSVNPAPSWVSNLHESASSVTSIFPWLKPYICGESGESDESETIEDVKEVVAGHEPVEKKCSTAESITVSSEHIKSSSPKASRGIREHPWRRVSSHSTLDATESLVPLDEVNEDEICGWARSTKITSNPGDDGTDIRFSSMKTSSSQQSQSIFMDKSSEVDDVEIQHVERNAPTKRGQAVTNMREPA